MNTREKETVIPLPVGRVIVISFGRKEVCISMSGKVIFSCTHKLLRYRFDYTQESLTFIVRSTEDC